MRLFPLSPSKFTNLLARGKLGKRELRQVGKEIDKQAAKIWGLSDSELAQISSFRKSGSVHSCASLWHNCTKRQNVKLVWLLTKPFKLGIDLAWQSG
jgi:hypothetical protein